MHARFRLPARPGIFAVCAVLIFAGCDQIKKWIDPAAPPPAPPVTVAPTPVTPPSPPPAAPTYVAPAPEQVVSDFQKIPSHRRDDARIASLAAVPEVAAQITEIDASAAAFTDTSGSLLPKFPNLKKLSLTQTKITNQTVATLAALPKLEELDLSRTAVTYAAAEDLAKLTNLRKLTLNSLAMSDESVGSLGNLPFLEDLSLIECSQVSGQSFTASVAKGGFKSLKSLAVTRTAFAAKGLEKIGSLPQLERLIVGNTGLTDVGLKYISQCDNLKVISISENLAVTDRGVALLGKIKTLEEIDITDCRLVTKIVFNTFKGLKNLKRISARNTQINTEAAKMLKEKFLPEVTIGVDGGQI